MTRFTLVEMMIVVAIVGILAAIAIPSVQRYQTNARLVEPELAVDAMWPLAVAAYQDGYWAATPPGAWETGWVPRDSAVVDKSLVAWSDTPAGAEKWAEIGFEPTGPTRCADLLVGERDSVGLGVRCNLNSDSIALGHSSGLAANGQETATFRCVGSTVLGEMDESCPDQVASSGGWHGQMAYSMTCR